jgi:hypothetical protein
MPFDSLPPMSKPYYAPLYRYEEIPDTPNLREKVANYFAPEQNLYGRRVYSDDLSHIYVYCDGYQYAVYHGPYLRLVTSDLMRLRKHFEFMS